MSQEVKNRLKSFAWRLGSMVVMASLAFVLDNAELLQVPSWGVVVLGLLSGELTKYLRKYDSILKF